MTLRKLAIGVVAIGLVAAVSVCDASARARHHVSSAVGYDWAYWRWNAWEWSGLFPGYYHYVGLGYGPCTAGVGYGRCTFNGWW